MNLIRFDTIMKFERFVVAVVVVVVVSLFHCSRSKYQSQMSILIGLGFV